MVLKNLTVEDLIETLNGYPKKMQVCGMDGEYDRTWYTPNVDIEIIQRAALEEDEFENEDISLFNTQFLSIQ